jgi:hypothetical protein
LIPNSVPSLVRADVLFGIVGYSDLAHESQRRQSRLRLGQQMKG